jgi:hypothetical protein
MYGRFLAVQIVHEAVENDPCVELAPRVAATSPSIGQTVQQGPTLLPQFVAQSNARAQHRQWLTTQQDTMKMGHGEAKY